MTPRLESSARDYAIACLSTGESMGRVLSAFRGPVFDAAFRVWSDCPDEETPLVRARLALYLRLLRRVEAWERSGRFSFTHWACFTRDHPTAGPVYSIEAVRIGASAKLLRRPLPATPWRPLWTSAPPHEPGVTARMRRSAKP